MQYKVLLTEKVVILAKVHNVILVGRPFPNPLSDCGRVEQGQEDSVKLTEH